MMMRFFIGVMMAFALVQAADTPSRVNAELRGAWVATVYNIDWPSSSKLSESEQKKEMITLLDTLQYLKMNAVFFQVRSECDAVYDSKYEPWAKCLTGKSGKYPGFDPLRFLIEEAHARGIEVHAWFNPFRIQANAKSVSELTYKHVAKKQPNLAKKYRNYLWLEPSSYASQERALRAVDDVLRRYDVDGIHLDDYFYPYPKILKDNKVEEEFPDWAEYQQYRDQGGRESRYEWRRGNINRFVFNLSHRVSTTKPWVRFGISPFGIWKPGYPRGIEAKVIAYDHLAADSRYWFKKGWVDYLAPQLYWSKNQPEQSFTKLFDWWVDQEKAALWPGIASSRVNDGSSSSRPASEIVEQIRYTRRKSRVAPGHIHWSAKAILENRDGLKDKLKAVYVDAATVPENPRAKNTATSSVKVRVSYKNGTTKVEWPPTGEYVGSFLVQAKFGRSWFPMRVFGKDQRSYEFKGKPTVVSVQAINRYGKSGAPSAVEIE